MTPSSQRIAQLAYLAVTGFENVVTALATASQGSKVPLQPETTLLIPCTTLG